ncbi:MAG: TPR end-of-group domain-containing protein, partial [Gemmatimonadales bacterium]
YGLGCVLYEMLAGQMVFTGPSLKSVLTQQVTADPPLINLSRPDIPAPVVAIVRRCLMKEPNDRYQSAAEVAEALRETLSDLPRLSTPVPQVPAGPAVRPGMLASAGRWLVPAALLVTLALGVTLFYRRSDGPAAPASETGPYTAAVAVLPFDNLNGDPANDYFSEGITQEIISQLAQVESLKVISRTSVVALEGSSLTLPQIADTLDVRHVVEGAVRRQGNTVRVTAELIEAATEEHLWVGSFEGDLADSFRVQEEIAREVSGQLLSGIHGMRPMTARAMPTEGAAFDALLRGRYLLDRRTAQSMEEAIEAFEEAVRLDSAYAPAYAGLSSAYIIWVGYGYVGSLDRYAATAKANLLAERAIALDPDLAEAHQARADALSLGLAPDEEVFNELREARRLMPSSAGVHMSVAHALGRSGKWEGALRQAQRALALDPLSTGLRHHAIVLALGARKYGLAFEEARWVAGLAPGDPVPTALQGYSLLLRGQGRRCAALDTGPWLALKAMCLLEVGRTADATALSDSLASQLLAGRYTTLHQFVDMAAYYARLGDVDRSLEWLERATRLTPTINYWQLHSGLFDRVRDDPGFQAGLARLEHYVRFRVAEERRKLDGPVG